MLNLWLQGGRSLTGWVAASFLCGLIAVSTGCHLGPNFGPQGTIGAQRAKAVLHDPFPSNDLGPPVMGGRPLGFERPLPEPIGNQISPYRRPPNQGSYAAPYQGF